MTTARRIAVGITGGIAAYKISDLVSRLTKNGYEVHVIMTESATRFITPLTMRTLSTNPVMVDMFDESSPWRVQHIGIAEQIDLMVIAPATANTIAKMACGMADNLLVTVALATRAPILVVPSMNTNMYEHTAVQANTACLRDRGCVILDPDEGELACGVTGKGRLPEIDLIYKKIEDMLSPAQDLEGMTFLITAGPTQEDLDPVRYITNHSTGKMGYALAAEARAHGARVILVSGPSNLPDPFGVEVIRVRSAREMHKACMEVYPAANVVIGTAAVADYRPADYSPEKIKKTEGDLTLTLSRNPDILGEMGKAKEKQLLVGFAAETNDLLANGSAKLQKKNLDLLVANDVTQEGAGFGSDTNIVTLIGRDGGCKTLPRMSKNEVAKSIINAIIELK